jgi:hypothetical protein
MGLLCFLDCSLRHGSPVPLVNFQITLRLRLSNILRVQDKGARV